MRKAASCTGSRALDRTYNGLQMPSALPVPDAPRVHLPANEGAEVAAARRLVVDWLGEMRRDAAELHAEGASPDDEANAFRKLDVLATPAIVAALNAERPGLNLVYAHCVARGDNFATDPTGFGPVDWDALVQDIRPGRWRVLVDNDPHGVALDMAVVNIPGQPRPRASGVLLNPLLSPEVTRAGVVAEIADQLRLPADWSLLVAEVPAQKSLRSCKIFALSMALKCAGGAFDQTARSMLLPPSTGTATVRVTVTGPAQTFTGTPVRRGRRHGPPDPSCWARSCCSLRRSSARSS